MTLNIKPYSEAVSRIEYVRPGKYSNLEEALDAFRRESIRYLVLDGYHIKRRPFLRDVSAERYRDRFELLKQFEGGDTLRDVSIYEIKY